MRNIARIILLCCLSYRSYANIKLPAVLSNNMVLQQKSMVKLWGWSQPAEKIFITTSWNGKTDSVMATHDANWQLTVQTPAAGGPFTITFKGYNQIVLSNVMIGEVWVCSGQSNMEFSLMNGVEEIRKEFPTAFNTNIRLCQISKSTSETVQDNCDASWAICDSNSLKSFSAVAYYFGKKLNMDLNVPIGLISSNWGGTGAEVWTPAEVVNSDTTLSTAAAKLGDAAWWPRRPGAAYNVMIAPLIRMDIAGTIWYQGESNTGTASTYTALMNKMIDSWRMKWGKDFPFYYVQIAPYKYGNYNIGALLQEAQMKTMQHKNTGMVVISDLVTDTTNIHPLNKHDVGARLANWALAETYGKPGIIYKSPFYKEMMVDKNKAIISFDNLPNGFKTNSKITEIYIAGADKVFVPAMARIEKDKIIVWSKELKQPVAVRYGFGNTSIGNLASKEGLPVAAFRTDDWEVTTAAIK